MASGFHVGCTILKTWSIVGGPISLRHARYGGYVPPLIFFPSIQPSVVRRKNDAVGCFLAKVDGTAESRIEDEAQTGISAMSHAAKRLERKRAGHTYLLAATTSSLGFISFAAAAVSYRFAYQMEEEIPFTEMLATFSLAGGAAVGMEYWARWAHRVLWHASLWQMHESHHRPRDGPFELNDVFAVINAVPAISLLTFGFFNRGIFPSLCFGAGLGITMFGMAYMFVHDGLVHRRFPVGPIAKVPYFRRVAAAHQVDLEVAKVLKYFSTWARS